MIANSYTRNTNQKKSSLQFIEDSSCIVYNYTNKLIIRDYDSTKTIREINFDEDIFSTHFYNNFNGGLKLLVVVTVIGNIYVYNLDDFKQIQEISTDKEVSQAAGVCNEKSLFIVTKKKDLLIFEFSEYNLLQQGTHNLKKVINAYEATNQDASNKNTKKELKANLRFKFITNLGSSYLFLASEKNIYQLNIEGDSLSIKKKVHHTVITSMKANETKGVLCVGDNNGRLTYYNSVLKNFNDKNIFHWHSGQVSALDFANCGEMVLSGGLEGVIVVWYYGGAKKDFCPRVEGEITEIQANADGDKIALKLSNNVVKVISLSNFEPLDEVSDIHLDNLSFLDACSNRAFGQTCMVSGDNYLNLLDSGNSLVKRYNLLERNLTLSSDISKGSKLRIQKISLSLNGKWLAVLEGNSGIEESNFSYTRLVFFRIEKNAQNQTQFTKNNSIDVPHTSGKLIGLVAGSEFYNEETGTASGEQYFCSWNNQGELKAYALGINTLASNAENLIWESFYRKNLFNENIQQVQFMNSPVETKTNMKKFLQRKLLVLLDNRIVVMNIDSDKILKEISPQTEGTLKDCILFNGNKEVVVHNSMGEGGTDEILWLDLKEQEPKWTEQLQNVRKIFKIGENNFGISLDVKNQNSTQGTLLLLCTANGFGIKEYSMFPKRVQKFWVSWDKNSESKLLVNGLNMNNDICTIELARSNAERGRKKSSMDIEHKKAEGDSDEEDAKIAWEGGDWNADAEEDFFQMYKTRNSKPVKIENLFYEKSHLMPNINMLVEQNFDNLLISHTRGANLNE